MSDEAFYLIEIKIENPNSESKKTLSNNVLSTDLIVTLRA